MDDDGMSSVGMDVSSAARAKLKGADLNVLAGYSTNNCIIAKQGDSIVFSELCALILSIFC